MFRFLIFNFFLYIGTGPLITDQCWTNSMGHEIEED